MTKKQMDRVVRKIVWERFQPSAPPRREVSGYHGKDITENEYLLIRDRAVSIIKRIEQTIDIMLKREAHETGTE